MPSLLALLPRSLLPWLALLARVLLAGVRRLVAPPRCAACDEAAPPTTVFCAPCAASVEPAAALLDDVAFASYGGALAIAVRRFKYGARPDLARPLGHLLRRAVRAAAADLDFDVDLVVPVPLHPRKLRERGYNQAALLAAAVAREVDRPLAARALLRTRDTAPQASKGRTDRLGNMAGAFRVRAASVVRARNVLLVDDVATTGATLNACRSALLAAGAARVATVVLARADKQCDEPPEGAPARLFGLAALGLPGDNPSFLFPGKPS